AVKLSGIAAGARRECVPAALIGRLRPASQLHREAPLRPRVMATLDHIILKVNDLGASVAFYTEVLGFSAEGMDGPFTVLRAGPDFQIQMTPCGTQGFEHYAFAVSKNEFETILSRIK